LGNSQSFQETLVREVARARRSGQPFSCVLLDLSDFRLINDQFGHEKGNQVLQAVAQMIRQIIRQKTDSAYRYGGDGFALILPESDGAQALSVAQRLRETLMALKPPTIPKKTLSANFVLASLREDARAEDLMRMLDRALVETKARGKDLIYEAPWAED
jgi:diguanylate cyclase (GGDEF)-like protein